MTQPRPSHLGQVSIVESDGFDDYRLVDSGNGRKLERFGKIVVDRPEPQALWRPRFDPRRWQSAHAVFAADGDDEAGRWRLDKPVPDTWPLHLDGITMLARLSAFRHLGLFPEQRPHWQWMLQSLTRSRSLLGDERPRVLNLFSYTGAATLLAARAGAEVVHVDASKKAIAWARENQAASGLGGLPVRWILDDARKFVARDVRRGRTYHVILVDPPKFGRGPAGEVWDVFENLPALLDDCAALLDPRVAHMILTSYAIRASAMSIGQLAAERLASRGGAFEIGELMIREEAHASPGSSVPSRLMPTSLFTRWSSHHAAA